MIRSFFKADQGQDLIEYTLLLAFVALASAALFISAGGSVTIPSGRSPTRNSASARVCDELAFGAAGHVLAAHSINLAMRNLNPKSGESDGFIHDETGQDMLEYALLLAFIALAGAAALLNMSGSTNMLWSAANSNLAAANSGS